MISMGRCPRPQIIKEMSEISFIHFTAVPHMNVSWSKEPHGTYMFWYISEHSSGVKLVDGNTEVDFYFL